MSAVPSLAQLDHVGILLVEDNAGDARLVREMLREGWAEPSDVVHVQGLADARDRLLESARWCVLLDLGLPDASGLEALERIREMAPDVPVIVLTGLEDEIVALRAVHEGAQDYLVKGQVNASLLSRSIRHAIERKSLELQLSHQALHDSLTGLPNRVLLVDRLGQALAGTKRGAGAVAVLFLDLDRFKLVNDSYGHAVGDQLLVAVAQRLQSLLRPDDTVARLGGDEFVILLNSGIGKRAALRVGDRIIRILDEPFSLDQGEVFTTASIGLSLGGDHSDSPDTLLREADAAMYRAKSRGGRRLELFDSTLRDRAVVRLETASTLHRAVENRELRIHYQPMVDLSSGRIFGVEALLRWEPHARATLGPADFIPVAEETGLIIPIGAWTLEQALRDASTLQAAHAGDEPLILAINLSPRQLAQPRLTDYVARALTASVVDPHALSFEITEGSFLDGPETAISTLQGLRDRGIQIALDDFGTGYSSLDRLKRLPVDSLKIDQTFVAGLGTVPHDTAIVSGVISLAHALGLPSIAEGLETSDQLDTLRDLGCHAAQGFHFARPQPLDDVVKLLHAAPRW